MAISDHFPKKNLGPKKSAAVGASSTQSKPTTSGKKHKTSSTSGTTSTALKAKGLQGREICRIIETCQKNQVLEFKCGDLNITFSGAQGKRAPKDVREVTDNEAEVFANGPITKDIEQPQSLLTGSDDEAFDLMQEAQMLIDNPAQYETLMADRHLSQSRKTKLESTEDTRAQ